MKAILLTAVFAIALQGGHAVAEDQSEIAEMAANDLSHEMSKCAAFHNVVEACFLRGNQKEGAELARKSGVALMELAVWLGKRAGISKLDEVLLARNNMAIKDLRELI